MVLFSQKKALTYKERNRRKCETSSEHRKPYPKKLKRIKEMDWNSYYQEANPPEMQGMTSPKCNTIILVRQNQLSLPVGRESGRNMPLAPAPFREGILKEEVSCIFIF